MIEPIIEAINPICGFVKENLEGNNIMRANLFLKRIMNGLH